MQDERQGANEVGGRRGVCSGRTVPKFEGAENVKGLIQTENTKLVYLL